MASAHALLAAIDDNDLPAADRLIRSGADVNRRGPLPLTALMLAAGQGSTQMVGETAGGGRRRARRRQHHGRFGPPFRRRRAA